MTTPQPRYLSCAETAQLLRAALKEAFPTVTFSVRSRTYAGGASIDVRWTDGPTSQEVERVCARFEGADFDGMSDLKTYKTHLVNGERVRYGADYISPQRGLSVAFLTKIAQAHCTRYGYQMPRIVHQSTGAYIPEHAHAEEIMQRAWATGEATTPRNAKRPSGRKTAQAARPLSDEERRNSAPLNGNHGFRLLK